MDFRESKIRSTYSSAVNTAGDLEAVANSIKNLATSGYENALGAIRNAWQGENAERFLQKGYVIKEDLLEVVTELRNAARNIRSDAKVIYDRDMAAYSQWKKEQEEAALEATSHGDGSGGAFSGGGGSFGGGGSGRSF